ncbi:heavy metal translocating P-type ATPase [Bacteroides reticulotermitis]|uniref:P-type Zn(2+) transporter n=2 Tax=Bacteroides reticulotermitis TaxID=1133319 RepID=W4UYX3_9BACE|nr:heavy metal translocating P-type ATPase [Bacteroides reticulotermitis]MBB4045460.1 Cd2+/Zn2+-exporting ATPase [Bacteroides reticulotermitis]GAE86022.1 lead, cadmium, zinc and mercury transporting ATPase [Bacteroides reticulotermitis JCM 10512]
MGCNCCNQNTESTCSKSKTDSYKIYLPALVSFTMIIVGMFLKHAGLFENNALALAWYIIAYLPVGLPVLKEAFEGLKQKEFFNEFTLMCIATIGAFCIGEYPEGVAVMLFYTIGELFQDRAVGKAQRNIKALLDIRPESSTVIRNGHPVDVIPSTVGIGEVIEVKAGERVSLDGQMLNEYASFNTAALTGESRPRTIRQGDEVLAGMIATEQTVRIRVNKRYDESALSRILKMVQEASERKAPTELFIRRFARVYTPAVTLLAALVVLLPYIYSVVQPLLLPTAVPFQYDFSDWLYRGLVFLVISCPCALVVSIPLGYFGGIGAASRAGILFKGGNYLDGITKVNTVVFDKTGTLTKGVFEVQQLASAATGKEKELLSYMASAEQKSTHPIARAILQYARQQGVDLLAVEHSEEVSGHGLRSQISGHQVLIGNLRLLDANGIAYPASLSAVVDTIAVCAIDQTYAGYILLADSPKDDARTAITSLQGLNINNIQMLSGDKQAIVSKLAEHLGISKAYGDLMPEDKVEKMEALRKNPTNYIAFVGDGINDAPVLALSNIGIAMGGLGSDAAIETADVVIQTDQPSKIATAIRIGRQTRNIVWQNIVMALGIKLLVLTLGVFGVATLWEAVFADVGVALLAILNAIRIKAPDVE